MKKQCIVLAFILFACATLAVAQIPQGFSYQSVLRDNAGNILADEPSLPVRFKILDGADSVYVETHTASTNQFGLLTLTVGQGTPVLGDFSAINWSTGIYSLKVEIDFGSGYEHMGTNTLLTVPFAMVAGNAGGVGAGQNPGDMLYWNGTAWVVVSGGTEEQTLKFCGGVPTWTSGNCPGVPNLVTNAATGITVNFAFSGGSITDDGGSPVVARGVCWSTSPNPTIANDTTLDGSGVSNFISQLTGLSHSTIYYVRAYAINSSGVGYGDEINFSTLSAPSLITSSISNISYFTAAGGGTVVADGGSSVTARGICWNTTGNPTTADNNTTNGSGTGSFTSSLTSLQNGTTYYVRAYATNTNGTGYGNEVSFTTTAFGTVTDIDGNVYNTLPIGIQIWMQENLKVSKYQNGDAIPNVTDSASWYTTTQGRWANYDNNVANDAIYGKLYNWHAVADVRNICPSGWHMPTATEWIVLTDYLTNNGYGYGGSGTDIGKSMAATSG